MESGQPARIAVKKYLRESRGEFADLLLSWHLLTEQGKTALFQAQNGGLNAYRRSIFDLLDFSLQGVSILEPLHLLEKELRDVSEQRLEAHLGQLPFKLMIPLLLFQFPSLLLLILGPLLIHLMKEVQ
jgi:tight adherence protein C